MLICGYWDCIKEVNEKAPLCHEHSLNFHNGRIDQCPKCGRYKQMKVELCPDCRHGRPIADWKISSRNLKAIEYAILEFPEKSDDEKVKAQYTQNWGKRGAVMYARGEAACPSCGSSDLFYKSVFDYFKCNKCQSTFITPVDKSIEEKGSSAIESTKALTSQMFSTTQLERREIKEIEPSVNVGTRRKPSKVGWLFLLLIICLLVIITVAVWKFYGNQIELLLGEVL